MPYAIARNEVSNGALGLLRLAFDDELREPRALEALRSRFLQLYTENVCIKSSLFILIEDLSNATHDMPWGIVTNKPHAMTMPLLKRLGIDELAAALAGLDAADA